MARGNSDHPTPKRGAYPTPKNVLADATPYKPNNNDKLNKPDKPGSTGDQPNSKSDSAAESREKTDCASGEKDS